VQPVIGQSKSFEFEKACVERTELTAVKETS